MLRSCSVTLPKIALKNRSSHPSKVTSFHFSSPAPLEQIGTSYPLGASLIRASPASLLYVHSICAALAIRQRNRREDQPLLDGCPARRGRACCRSSSAWLPRRCVAAKFCILPGKPHHSAMPRTCSGRAAISQTPRFRQFDLSRLPVTIHAVYHPRRERRQTRPGQYAL